MIESFRNKELETLFRTGKCRKIPKEHWERLLVRLGFLNRMCDETAVFYKSSWHAHKLHGRDSNGQDVDGYWSIRVTGTWRLTYYFTEDRNVILVDYIDYH